MKSPWKENLPGLWCCCIAAYRDKWYILTPEQLFVNYFVMASRVLWNIYCSNVITYCSALWTVQNDFLLCICNCLGTWCHIRLPSIFAEVSEETSHAESPVWPPLKLTLRQAEKTLLLTNDTHRLLINSLLSCINVPQSAKIYDYIVAYKNMM